MLKCDSGTPFLDGSIVVVVVVVPLVVLWMEDFLNFESDGSFSKYFQIFFIL